MATEHTDETDEALISSWVSLTAILKNTRITQGMNYNEAIVMMTCYHRFREDGIGEVSFRELVAKTAMLKSLVNRTVNALLAQGYLTRRTGEDRRTCFVRPVKERLDAFLEVHSRSLDLARAMRKIIGEEDARAFIRLVQKISAAPLEY